MQLFLVGKIVSEKHWEVQGIYDSEEKALSASVDQYHFIGPLTLNKTLPLESSEWPGAYYPKLEKNDISPLINRNERQPVLHDYDSTLTNKPKYIIENEETNLKK